MLQLLTAESEEEIRAAADSEVLSNRLDMDGLPTLITRENREEFTNLYCYNVMMQRKPYIDQLMCGLNHGGVSDTQRIMEL